MEPKAGKTKICIVQGDITEQNTDAIVNAANSTLLGGGGVDGAIHRKGGEKILEECKKIRNIHWPKGLPTGKAVITTAGELKTRYIIHTVGPIWAGGKEGESELLRDAYVNSLLLAISEELNSIAFPSISTGAYGYPFDQACRIALTAVKEILDKDVQLDEVRFVLFSQKDRRTYTKFAEIVF